MLFLHTELSPNFATLLTHSFSCVRRWAFDCNMVKSYKKVMPFSGSFGVKIGTPGFLFPEFLSCKDSLQLLAQPFCCGRKYPLWMSANGSSVSELEYTHRWFVLWVEVLNYMYCIYCSLGTSKIAVRGWPLFRALHFRSCGDKYEHAIRP